MPFLNVFKKIGGNVRRERLAKAVAALLAAAQTHITSELV